jgi:uncharacterized protein (TIGR02453 family)
MPFGGFPEAGVHFLRELRENNEKPWFEANRKRFLETVQQPALDLVQALGTRLQEAHPEIVWDLRTNGGGSLMRIYRDTRFSPDKSPYKTNVAMIFSARGERKMAMPGFGLQITPEEVGLVAGVFTFDKPVLERYRQAVMTERSGRALDAAAAQIRKSGEGYAWGGQTYRRVPTGYAADHPRADWLKYTGLHVYSPTLTLELAATPALVDEAMTHFAVMAPVYEWLMVWVYAWN